MKQTIFTIFILLVFSSQSICSQTIDGKSTETQVVNTADTIILSNARDSSVLASQTKQTTDSTIEKRESVTYKTALGKKLHIKETPLGEFARTTHWGIMGGLGFANVHFGRYDMYQHPICNVRLGVMADYDLTMATKNLFVEAGVEFQRKGYQRYFNQHADSLHTDYKEKTNLYYIIIPTNVSYRLHFHGFEFTPTVGLYYGIAMGGRFKYVRKTNDRGDYMEAEKKYSMFGDKSGTDRLYDTRRFDLGLRLAVGIEYFKGMRSSLGYDFGFIDYVKTDFRGDKYKSKNGVFYISHTYFFQ